MFGDTKPKSTAAVIEDGALCFKSDGKPGCTVLRLSAGEENLRLYSGFITEGSVIPDKIK